MEDTVTVCLASCNRFDLLEKTLDSFFSLNTYPINEFLITEDSTNADMKDKILNKYGNKIKLIFNEVNLGPYKTFDNMYQQATSKFIFHCEDDWLFESNPNFMKDSIDILNERDNVHQVWIRKTDVDAWLEKQSLMTSTKVLYKMVKSPHLGDWCGFSGNPGLRRKADYDRIFPNGYSEFKVPGFVGLTEHNCNLHAAKHGWRAASLTNAAIVHIGNGRTTIK